MKKYSDFPPLSKEQAYWERNQILAALSKTQFAWLAKHPESDKEWGKEWRNIVVIVGIKEDFSLVQMTWHIHDNDLPAFSHLKYDPTFVWDGHDTDEKYARLSRLQKGGVFLKDEVPELDGTESKPST